jgi:hypothetical protein
MSKPENAFIASVHRYLPSGIYRMKNHNQYNGGIPDVWYSGSKSDLWIEYKFVNLPKRNETIIDLTSGNNPILSALQQEWLTSRYAEGRNVAVVVGSKLGGVWLPNLEWGCKLTTYAFCNSILSRIDLAKTIQKRIANV